MDEKIPSFHADHTIVLVMDYQRAILSNYPGADALLTRMSKVIAAARGHGLHIGYVRVAFDDADYAGIPEANARFKAIAAGRGMHKDAPETAIHDVIAPEPGDIIVRKTRVGAFTTTDLDKQLHDKNIDTLILAGVSTSGVVLSTVREAADRDYRIYVLADGSADSDAEVHDVLTQKIFPRQATVISTADLLTMLDAQ